MKCFDGPNSFRLDKNKGFPHTNVPHMLLSLRIFPVRKFSGQELRQE
jgi:hypothetical protein